MASCAGTTHNKWLKEDLLCNPGIFRTLTYSELEAYSAARYIHKQRVFRTLSNICDGAFCEIVNSCNYFCKS